MEESLSDEVVFVYDYSNFYRSVHIHGAFGGVTPSGDISASFYSERGAMPRRTTHSLLDDGSLGDAIESELDGTIQRDFEVEVFMSIGTARSLYEWLGTKITDWERFYQMQRERNS